MVTKVKKAKGTYQVCHQVDYTDAVSYRLSEKMGRSEAIATAWRDRSVVMLIRGDKILWHAPGVWPVWPRDDRRWFVVASAGPRVTNWRRVDVSEKHVPRIYSLDRLPTQHCAICASPLLNDGHHALFLGRICDACEAATVRTKVSMSRFYAPDDRRWGAWLKKWNRLVDRLRADPTKQLVLR